jgi:3-deoxy-D-manno-octulosonic-acid transferase
MLLFYDIGLALYSLSARIASLFSDKARLFVEGRKNIFQHLKDTIDSDEDIVWIHAASLGEFEQGRPIIEGIKEDYPETKILLTFYSPSGYEIRKNYMYADYIFYLPKDSRSNALKFIETVQPKKAIFIKYEYWYHYLMELRKWDIPTYIVSAILRPDQVFFKWYASFYKRALRCFTHFFVQNEASASLLKENGFDNYTICGDTRFDRVNETALDSPRNEIIEAFKGDKNILIAGSTWEPDEKILLNFLQYLPSNWKLIIAPHEVNEEHIQKFSNKLLDSYALYTETDTKDVSSAKVLIINTIGILSSTYSYGNIAYIGGGFGKGIHNILEAATFSLPLIFGPNYKKFQEAIDLIEKEAAASISSYSDFEALMNNWLSDSKIIEKKGKASKSYISKNLGATTKILEHIGFS